MRARAQGQLTACKSNLKNIGTALEMYATDFEGRYPPSLSLLTPNYLKTLPECPSAATTSYIMESGLKAPGNEKKKKEFRHLECRGEHHKPVGLSAGYPRYNTVEGLIER